MVRSAEPGAGDSGNETQEGSPNSTATPDTLDLPAHPGHPPSASPPPTPTNFSDKLQDNLVIRPVAFKPVTLSSSRIHSNVQRYGSTPSLARPGSHLTLYGSSSDLRQRRNFSLDRKRAGGASSSGACSPLTLSSLPLTSDSGHRSLGYESLDSVYAPPVVLRSTRLDRNGDKSGSMVELEMGVPPRVGSDLVGPGSPCESSCAAELEAALRERDSELQYLRETMEHNEQVIFHVYQEKERAWEREMRRLKQLQDTRLRAHAHKTLKLEQMLMMQTYQLQEDKKRLREERERAEEESVELKREVELLRNRLDETEWGLCQKSGEIALLKSQLKDCQNDQSAKCHELASLRSEVRELKSTLESRDNEIKQLTSELDKSENRIKDLEIDCLKSKPDDLEKEFPERVTPLDRKAGSSSSLIDYKDAYLKLRDDSELQQQEWDKERLKWAEEKDKVLQYQRQLQLNYVHMYRRTQFLEEEIQRLGAELDREAEKKKIMSISQTSIQL